MNKIINIVSAFAVILLMTACEGMMDIHKDYLEGGEKVYLSKPLSVNFRAGHDRVVAELVLYNSPNVKTVDISWNSGRDTQSTPVSLSTGLDTLLIPITGLEERAYTFTLVTTDAYGNHSLPFTGTSAAYGALFQASLNNQPIRQIDIAENGGQIQWVTSLDFLLSNEIQYVSKNGENLTVLVPAGVVAALPEAKVSSKVTYRSLFLPETTAIDTFYTEWSEYETAFPESILADKSTFTMVYFTSQSPQDGGYAMNVIADNNNNTFWQSAWNPLAYLPHTIVVDMGKSRHIVKVGLSRRSDVGDTKTVHVLVGPDYDPNAGTWKEIGTVFFPNDDRSLIRQVIDIEPTKDTEGRYMKLYFTDSYRSQYVAIAEIDVYID
jgi:hypothetical protein